MERLRSFLKPNMYNFKIVRIIFTLSHKPTYLYTIYMYSCLKVPNFVKLRFRIQKETFERKIYTFMRVNTYSEFRFWNVPARKKNEMFLQNVGVNFRSLRRIIYKYKKKQLGLRWNLPWSRVQKFQGISY